MLISYWQRLQDILFKPVKIGPLVVFRLAFGLLLFLESFGAILTGWVKRVFIEPDWTFTFISFFPWLQPLPGNGMIYYYGFMASMGLMVMMGWHYRKAVLAYFILWTLVYWMQKSSYNNHYYLLVILTGLAYFLPAHRFFSLDIKRKAVNEMLWVPAWTHLLFILLLWVVYTSAGLAKIQPDWLAARPIKIWFDNKSGLPILGGLLVKDWFQQLVAYGGIIFDLFFIPAVMYRRTRVVALLVALFFHVFNSLVFQIGIFPYLMLVMCVFFFDPNAVHQWFFGKKPGAPNIPQNINFGTKAYKQRASILFLLFFGMMLYLPIRHHFYPGNVNWTEEGHRMAWRMMLRHKTGQISFLIQYPDGTTKSHLPSLELSPKQTAALAIRPDMIWQYAQKLHKEYSLKERGNVEVYARSKVSLNGRNYQEFIDPEVDLAKEKWFWFQSHSWILPLTTGFGASETK